MRIFMKAVASTATVGLLAFGAVGGSGGTAFAGQGPSYLPIALCSSSVADVAIGYVPNCEAEGTIEYPNSSIAIGFEVTDSVSTLIDDQEGQGLTLSWELACLVNGTTVDSSGSYQDTDASQEDAYTVIHLQKAVGSPDPSLCLVEEAGETLLPLNEEDLDEAVPFQIGVASVTTIAAPGAIYQEQGTTSAGAHAELCADDAANGDAGAKIQAFQCLSDRADSFVQASTGQLVHNGDCVSVTAGGYAFLARCAANDALEQWTQSKVGGTLKNQWTGTCLTAPSVNNGIQLTVTACGSAANQQWYLPAAAAPFAPGIDSALGALFRK
jgi:hypothetical protein